jgi:hypothetical protein
MTRHRRLLLPLAASIAVVASTTAIGAPDRTANVAADGAAYTWQGGPMSGTFATTDVYGNIPCDAPGNDCDDTLIQTSIAGGATAQGSVKIDGPNGTPNDLDLFVYKSDAQGRAGAFVKSSAGGTADEQVTFDADPGFYLIRVIAATGTAMTYKGEVKVVARPLPQEVDYGRDPADPSDTGATGAPNTAASNAAPITTARGPRNSQSRLLSGTARDRDGRIAYVDLALVRVLRRSCRGLVPNGSFRRLRKCSAPRFLRARGTTRWSYTVRKRLPKGLYVLYARATDNFGRRDAGFGRRNRVTFRIT